MQPQYMATIQVNYRWKRTFVNNIEFLISSAIEFKYFSTQTSMSVVYDATSKKLLIVNEL